MTMTNDIVNVIVNDYDDDHELVLAYIQIQITQVRVYYIYATTTITQIMPAPDHQTDPWLWSIYDFLS